MARALSFNKELIIKKSMMVFWHKGYQGTSMRDIGQATGLNPGSLYGSFGNKRQLFHLVLENYYQHLTQSINQTISGSKNNNAILKDFFHMIINNKDNSDVKGCLLVNSLLELANDSELQSFIAAMFTGIEEMFYWVLVSGQKNGDFNRTLDARDMAQFLINSYFGIRVQCMTSQSDEYIASNINYFLARLE
jgi:TetR/AcrR family transcriptional repressor of nem operon